MRDSRALRVLRELREHDFACPLARSGGHGLQEDDMATGLLNTRRWKAASRRYRQRHPVCEACRRQPAALVHHQVPPSLAPTRLLDDANLASLCRRCHYSELTRVLLT